MNESVYMYMYVPVEDVHEAVFEAVEGSGGLGAFLLLVRRLPTLLPLGCLSLLALCALITGRRSLGIVLVGGGGLRGLCGVSGSGSGRGKERKIWSLDVSWILKVGTRRARLVARI